MRIIAGRAKGRRLAGPAGDATRPLTDRVREALFSSLGSVVAGARVLDLYAGTGSFGLEALSRGAASCVFVERDRRALAALRRNIATVDLGGAVVATEVARYLRGPVEPADLVCVDPPYGLALASVAIVLEELEPRLPEEATVVVHRRRGEDPPGRVGALTLADRRHYGDAELWRFHHGSALDGSAENGSAGARG